MKNYLKKAISAVIALALAASIVPASFAAVALTDVPETADYATAVNTLVALNVVNGYEDNTFLPDNKITRAEASKIIVAALNETAAADAMKGATKFSDIAAKHEWATGYINKGVSMGYINGMENNTFQPDGNVTYAQIIKMLLCAMGYEDYAASLAEQYGYTGANWYVPFTQLAADTGVTDGVYANPNDAVTRAQVAQLVYNAVKAPIVKNVGVSYTDSGKIVPKIQIQDGSDNVYFKSILTEKFDAYFVEGYVVKTQKDNTGLKADEVDFAIAKTQKYDQEDVCILNAAGKVNNVNTLAQADVAGRRLTKVKVGDTAAAEYKGTYATAIVVVDEYEDWSLLNFIPSGRNKSTKIALEDLDTAEYENGASLDQTKWTAIQTSSAPYIKFFVDGAKTSTKYMLDAAANVKVYVNGVYVATGDPIWTYVINGDIGDVELVDTYKTDGKIDTIYVNKYVSGMFAGITSAGKVSFTSPDAGLTQIVLDDEDETLEYHIYYNGEEITVSELKKDDVLTIAYDPTGAVKDSKFYDIYVSRDVVTDTLKGKDADEKAAKFGDTYYTFASTAKYNSQIAPQTVKLGDEYTLYLDAFGRVFKAEQNTSVANWAIAEKFTKASSDDYYKLTVFTADGSTKAYFLNSKKASVTIDGVAKTETDAALNAVVGNRVYASGFGTANTVKNSLDNRVITYKVSASSGMITELNFMDDASNNTLAGVNGKEPYSARRNSIGNMKLSEVTKVIDATKYASDEELAVATYESLVDEVNYKAYAYGTKIDGIYPFVLVTEGEAAFTAATRFAVVTEDGYKEEADEETGDIVYSIAALYGDAESLIVSDDVSTTVLNGLKKGEVIFFKTNAKGQVTAINKLFSFVGGSIPSQAQLAAWSLVNTNTNYANLATNIAVENAFGGNFSADFTTNWDSADRDAIKVVYGPVIEVGDKDISIGKVNAAGKTNTETEVSIFEYSDDIRVYTYDYSQGDKYRFEYQANAISAIPATLLIETNMEADGITVDWNKIVEGAAVNKEAVNFAFAIVVNDEVQDIFAFLAK